MAVIALTGPTGSIGTQIRPILAAHGHEVRLVHRNQVHHLHPTESAHKALLNDADALVRAFASADLVVHLAGISGEDSWDEMVEVNITGTRNVLHAASEAGVGRVLLASSNHAVGMIETDELANVPVPHPAPDSYYGMSKAAVEALGALFGGRFEMSVVSARIGTASPEPTSLRSLSTWFSAADFVRLIEACAKLEEPGHWIVWGISNNTRGWVDHSESKKINFAPQDDAEDFAPQVLEAEAEREESENTELLGADLTEKPVGK